MLARVPADPCRAECFVVRVAAVLDEPLQADITPDLAGSDRSRRVTRGRVRVLRSDGATEQGTRLASGSESSTSTSCTSSNGACSSTLRSRRRRLSAPNGCGSGRRTLGAERFALREHAIGEELATRPPWLEATLGPEPQDTQLRARWAQTAREIAGHRIDNHITDSHVAFSEEAGIMR